MEFRITTPFFEGKNTRMIPIFNNSFNHRVLYILKNQICLIVFWDIKLFDKVTQEIVS